jgi:hypothetical protein
MVHVNSSQQSTKFSEMKSLFSEGFINFVMKLISAKGTHTRPKWLCKCNFCNVVMKK